MMTRRERYLGCTLLVLALIWALTSSMAEARRLLLRGEIFDEGCGFGTRFIGLPFPHARRHLNLLKRDHYGRWILLWHSVSFQLESSFSWQDKIVFGAITQYRTGDDPVPLRILMYERSTGALVDITNPILRAAGSSNFWGFSGVKARRNNDAVTWEYFTSETHEFTTTLNQLCDFAREVRHHGRRRVFDDFGVWEERE